MSHYIQGPQVLAILASNLSYFGEGGWVQQGDFLDEEVLFLGFEGKVGVFR